MNNTGNQEINPITRLDYPDPDVIRVDNTYYMVSTTMHFMPGCEILRSYDLVNWEHASYVYDVLDSTPGQKIEGEENIYGQGMWAASLRYHKGIFYVCLWQMIPGKHTFIQRLLSKDRGKRVISRAFIMTVPFCLMMMTEST